MAKSNLLKIMAITATITLVGCASKTATDAGEGATSTEAAATATELVEAAAPVVTEMASAETVASVTEEAAPAVEAAPEATESFILQFKAPEKPAYSEPAVVRPMVNVVYFDFDKAGINPEFRKLLDQHGDYLATTPGAKVILAGHADERGTREYNLALGERRAYAVYAYLKLRGVAPDQMEMVSYGEEMPVSVGKSEADYAKNRRVEFKYQ